MKDHGSRMAGPLTKSALALLERRQREEDRQMRLAAKRSRPPKPKSQAKPKREQMQPVSIQRTAKPVSVSSTITDVSRNLGLSLRAIRFYEERGLITCGRGAKNSRVLDEHARARLAIIVELKGMGLQISEIADLLDDDGVQRSILGERLRDRLTQLDEQRALLSDFLARLTAS